MISHDDPRWTAYALGELDGDDRAAVEAALTTDAEARALVEEIRAEAATLEQALRSEPAPALTLAQRGTILEAAAAAAGAPAAGRVLAGAPWRRWVPMAIVGTAAAAMVVLALQAEGPPPEGAPITRESAARSSEWRGGYDAPPASGPVPAGTASTAGDPRLHFEAGRPQMDVNVKTLEAGAKRAAAAADGLILSAGASTPAGSPVAPPKVALPASGARDGRVQAAPAPVPVPPPVSLREPGDGLTAAHPLQGLEVLLTSPGTPPPTTTPGDRPDAGGERYDGVVESAFLRVQDAPLSTLSIDVDTASYANVRRMLNDGQRPPAAAIRVEEMLNYFPYADPAPKGDDPFAVRTEVAACPWNLKHRLVRIGVHGKEIERKGRPASNLVFLIDVSGSMDQPNKLPLVQASMRMLLEELNERDTVSIVVYAGASGLVLPPTSCERKAVIQDAIDRLKAGGSTNGAAGISLAYDTAQRAFVKGGVNRVVLATDGDFNVGVTSHSDLLGLIQEKARSGVFLTCLGYGMGNLKDATLELLADKGNGNYGYVDSTREARKVLVEGASGTLVTIAKDVKIQVEFNPARVASYRLVGYDNRRLAAKDFNDDTKDAGEIGAGHTVTALYEVVPVGVEADVPTPPPTPEVDPLKYGSKPAAPAPAAPTATEPSGPSSAEMLTVKLRYKQPDGDTSVKREFPLTDAGASYDKASPDFKFASAVAAFALILKRSPYAGNASLEGVLELASEGLSYDPSGYRKEFLDLVAKSIALHLGK